MKIVFCPNCGFRFVRDWYSSDLTGFVLRYYKCRCGHMTTLYFINEPIHTEGEPIDLSHLKRDLENEAKFEEFYQKIKIDIEYKPTEAEKISFAEMKPVLRKYEV